MDRPECIKHYSEIQERDGEANHYPGSDELLSIGSPFGKAFNLTRLGIHHELLPPGRRTSWPHSHSSDEEFVYVIEGYPDVWINGELQRLKPGDGVGFPAGTGISHTVLNNTEHTVRLLVVGDSRRSDDLGFYPLDPQANERMKAMGRFWEAAPPQTLGSHDGIPKKMMGNLVD